MAGVNATVPERFAGFLTAIATAVVITAIAIVPFLTPAWVSFEQGRTGAEQLTGYTTAELRTATDAILADLVLGPPDFDVVVGRRARPQPTRAVPHARRARRVRGLRADRPRRRGRAGRRNRPRPPRLGHPERAWSAVRNGARGLAIGVVIAGVVAFFAFDAAFEVFHRLFFAGGSYTFDPGTDRLVQLFPFAFWSETTMAVGAVIIAISIAVTLIAGRRTARHAAPAETTPGTGRAHPEAAR